MQESEESKMRYATLKINSRWSSLGVMLLCLTILSSCAIFKSPEQVVTVAKQECTLPQSLTAPVKPIDPMKIGTTNRQLLERDIRWEAKLEECNARLSDVQKQYEAPKKASIRSRIDEMWGKP